MSYQTGLTQPLLDDVDRRLIQQRNDDMRQIVQDLSDLKDTMSEINSLVVEQRDDLNQIENNTAQAAVNIDNGTTEIKLASKYQQSYRKKICVIIILVIIAITIIILIILGATGQFGKRDGTPGGPAPVAAAPQILAPGAPTTR